ncbi:glycosyltransferase family 4 protein [Streptomyces sp. PSKA54]|uniref:Glycosyltransferase family 4 protein n=1 Tax=Streptomyces himalayensis subsp. aureolus TaxID=2758039 RepID=A0A7W2CZZ6_9ACTN|nr:glycosyltransferase family 4 protein [Streptomyces himalayensis]MBA4862208.1 glycosyltransferase family 4 protein [Streptomyces himalayensis subsp. aureolus]
MLPRTRTTNHRLTVFHLVQPVEGGVARVVTDLVGAQVLEGIRVVAACPRGTRLSSALADAGAEVHPWQAGRAPGPGLPGETVSASRLIRASRPDMVHAHSSKAGLAARLAVRGRIPTVFQPHAWSFDAVGGTTARVALAWERYAARWAERILCVSEAERRTGEAAGIAARWTVIRNGVDVRWFGTDETTAPPLEETILQLSRTPAQGPVVVCVGRLCPQKGQDVLLRAWPEITRAVPDARLVLVGDGPDRERLRTLASSGVLFAGAVDGTRDWMRAADVVVQPSRWEGMALAPLEAMACGRPVVLTDVSGARESLPPGHDRHCLVPPDDPRALAHAVGRLLTNPQLRDALGRQARSHARANFDVQDTVTAVSELYRQLLGLPQPTTTERITR